MDIKTIGVVGSGIMGSGIAQVAAVTGYNVIIRDINDDILKKNIGGIHKSLDKLVSKEKMTAADADAVKGRIKSTVAMEEVAQADFIVEAATENIAIKKEVYAAIDANAKPETILASNTSSISITELGSYTKRSERFIGMHFFNPVPVMKLLEVIPGYNTTKETLETTKAVGEKMGKIIVTASDRAGFIVSRLLDLYLNEAVFALDEGVGTVEDIDNGMVYGCNYPMGPLALTDLIGLDVILAVMEVMYRENGDAKYRPAPLLRKMVRAGKLGRKTGEGFYKY